MTATKNHTSRDEQNLKTQTALFGQGLVTAFRATDGSLRWAVNGSVHSSKSLAKALRLAGVR